MAIGEHDSLTRKRADQWEECIFLPALQPEYDLIRADKINTPGHITAQILDHLIHDDLVILDFTGLNSNVMYEAAIRHVAKKPFIHIAPIGTRIPFDIKDIRTVLYDPDDLKLVEKMITGIKSAVKEIESPDYIVPQIIKSQFDLDPIIKDPKAFVELLLKHIDIKTEDNSKGIVVVDDFPSLSTYSDSIFGPQKVTCPSCGTISSIPLRASPVGYYGISPNRHYKCNVCGNEFETPQKTKNGYLVSEIEDEDSYGSNGVTIL